MKSCIFTKSNGVVMKYGYSDFFPNNTFSAGIPLEIFIHPDSLMEIKTYIAAVGSIRKISVLCDGNTEPFAVEKLLPVVSGLETEIVLCGGKERFVDDETVIGRTIMSISPETDCIVSVGSGTLIDIGRYAAFRLKIPFWAVPTAPSMDGITSSVSPLVFESIKTTMNTKIPDAVFIDLSILRTASAELVSAGWGDLIGKLVADLDWQVSMAVTGEKYRPELTNPVLAFVRKGLSRDRDSGDILPLLEGLLLSGMAITAAGSSRPASASEHHISHLLEMNGILGTIPWYYHGQTVAVGTFIMSQLYRRFLAMHANEIAELSRHCLSLRNSRDWREERCGHIRRIYGPAAEKIERNFLLKKTRIPEKFPDPVSSLPAVKAIVASHENRFDEIDRYLKASGVLYHPGSMKIDSVILRSILIAAEEIRDRFTLLTYLDRLGLLEILAVEVIGRT